MDKLWLYNIFLELVTVANWKFVHVVVIVAIQLHTFGALQTMQYSFKPKAFMIIRNQSQKIALNIDAPSDRAEGVVD